MEKVEYSVYFVPVPIGNRADITLRAAFLQENASAFGKKLTELSAGRLQMTAVGEEFLPGPREKAK